MRTPKECARYMRDRYGKDAGIHCAFAIMNNDGRNPVAAAYWRAVREALPERHDADMILATIAAVHGDDGAEMMAVEAADKAKRRGAI